MGSGAWLEFKFSFHNCLSCINVTSKWQEGLWLYWFCWSVLICVDFMLRGHAQTLIFSFGSLWMMQQLQWDKWMFNIVLLTFWFYTSGVYKACPINLFLKLSKSLVSLYIFFLSVINSSCLKINKKENLPSSQKALESAAQTRKTQSFRCAICDMDLWFSHSPSCSTIQ